LQFQYIFLSFSISYYYSSLATDFEIMGCIPSHPQQPYQQPSQPYHNQPHPHQSVAPQMQPARSRYSAAIEGRLLNRIPYPDPDREAIFWRNMELTKHSSYSQGLILMGDESQTAGKRSMWAEIEGRQTGYGGGMGSGGGYGGGHGGNGGGSTGVGSGNNGGAGGNGNGTSAGLDAAVLNLAASNRIAANHNLAMHFIVQNSYGSRW
jgi:hypothetical protein